MKSWAVVRARACSIGTRRTPSRPASRSRLASSWIQLVTSVSAGPPLGGLYLKPPSSGGLCDGVTTMPSASRSLATAVVDEDRVRDDRGRRVAVGGVDPDVDAVRGQDPERGRHRGPGQRVGVAADEQRPVGALGRAVAADRLGRGGDVRLVERGVERGSAMAGRAEGDPLGGVGRVGPDLVVGADETVDVDEHARARPAGRRADRSPSADGDISGPLVRPGAAWIGPAAVLYRTAVGSDWPATHPKVTTWTITTSISTSRRGCPPSRHARPAPRPRPSSPVRRRRGRFALSLAMAPVLVLAVVATAAAGAAVISRMAEGYPGIENPGQPLAGAAHGVHDAARGRGLPGGPRLLRRSTGRSRPGPRSRPMAGRAPARASTCSTPPAHGYVIPGSRLPSGQVIMVVDQRVGATGVGACFGHPMP